ncbi:hypothetical protein [Corynebacterium ulcerans]|uniref:hypothetical protein n=1 Tax=Corynebacterium ulcerans TaxID=65058 RepID=UPI000269D0E5|nr:hypothetical protein [Corynebacterium ulcerans]KPJ24720.1 hypothetical protein AOT31_02600 [Corynebacterium ulcerans]MDK8889260.1 hypothetical protein [Corynebacterium ulcerans]BAM26748.1 hypothetical protein CULC0102_0547 [Corynebacterium ulcerans 0102]BBJ71408.1 hypothetical protein CULC0211_05420 [Corynebacterium ulcerans]BBJ73713.1 hypothetical protein CULCFH20161_05400 [Corynebacterium ulcerans]
MAKTDIQTAVIRALESQSWWLRRKDSLTSSAGLVLHLANLMAVLGGSNPWVNVVVAMVIGAAQLIIHAGTPGAITPSMEKRLSDAAPTPPVFDLDAMRNRLAKPAE